LKDDFRSYHDSIVRQYHPRSKFTRQQPSKLTPADFKGGPERPSERPPHTQHIDWHQRYPNEVILQGPTNRKAVALTFDDGPDDHWTPRIVSTLNRLNVKATFMCVGMLVRQHPDILMQMVQAGHVLGNHSWDHQNFTKIPLSEAKDEIERTTSAIKQAALVCPRFFRPPYGALDEAVIEEIIKLDYKILFWDVDSLDWSGITASQASTNVLAHTGPGDIILMHFAGGRGGMLEDTVQALPRIVETLRNEGYTFNTIPELLGQPAYHTTC